MFKFIVYLSSSPVKFIRFCTHSKYDVVTPPALHRISGNTGICLFNSILSASGVVGPLAASIIIFDFIFGALVSSIAFSRAAGMNISISYPKSRIHRD